MAVIQDFGSSSPGGVPRFMLVSVKARLIGIQSI